MRLLKQLCSIQATSGDESAMADFLLDYIKKNSKNWKVKPVIYSGEQWQENIILVFGQPKTAVYAHIDSIGYTTGYNRNLIKIGGPHNIDGTKLVGKDSKGKIEAELMVIENQDGSRTLEYLFKRDIERGTPLTFKPNWRETKDFVQCCYMDNRLGVWTALKMAGTLENGAIVFSTYEEHGGGSVGYIARFLQEKYGIRQSLVADITWVTKGVKHGKGVAVSMRDSGIPRRKFVNRIITLAKKSKIPFQLEVESAGGSDGTEIQKSNNIIDWCFIGAPEDHVHSPDEIVHKKDIKAMVDLYIYLMKHL
ncbi:MAG: aminopeptidase [Bacteroidota bacterium]